MVPTLLIRNEKWQFRMIYIYLGILSGLIIANGETLWSYIAFGGADPGKWRYLALFAGIWMMLRIRKLIYIKKS
jgi:hypothetical protein